MLHIYKIDKIQYISVYTRHKIFIQQVRKPNR